jgi:hypothetical protein
VGAQLLVDVVEVIAEGLRADTESASDLIACDVKIEWIYYELWHHKGRRMPGVTSDVMNNPYDQWTKGLSKEQLQQQLDFYKKRYNQ